MIQIKFYFLLCKIFMSFTIQLPTPGTHAASPISAYWSVPASGLRKGSIICAVSTVPPLIEKEYAVVGRDLAWQHLMSMM